MAVNTSIESLLSADIVSSVISQVAGTSSKLLNFFGMQPGGNAVSTVGGREYAYDVFNDSRNVAGIQSPGAPSQIVARQKVATVAGTYARVARGLPLLLEELNNFRTLGQSPGKRNGLESYIGRQLRYMGQLISNNRVAVLAGLLRDSLYVVNSGTSNSYLTYTSGIAGSVQLSSRIPAGNKSQLDMLGTGSIIGTSWATVATATVYQDLLDIDAAFQQLYGGRLERIICPATIWSYVTANTDLKNRTGTAMPVFTVFERATDAKDANGNPVNWFTGRLAALPWIEWMVTDEGLNLGAEGSETYTKVVGENNAIFLPSPRPDLFEMREGSEMVIENDGDQAVERLGVYSWVQTLSNPARKVIQVVDNMWPIIYVPNSVAYGTVVF